jgi:hypothetical protein
VWDSFGHLHRDLAIGAYPLISPSSTPLYCRLAGAFFASMDDQELASMDYHDDV